MLNGNELWKKYFAYDLTKTSYGGYAYDTYADEYLNAYCILKEHASSSPNKIFLRMRDKSLNFSELLTLVDSCSEYLLRREQLSSGDWIAAQMYNSIEFLVLFLCCQKLSLVFVPIPGKYSEHEVEFIVADAPIKLFVVDRKFSASYRKKRFILREDFFIDSLNDFSNQGKDKQLTVNPPGCLALLMFTSGTTGKSKAAKIYNYNLFHAAKSYEKVFMLNEKSKTLLAIPMYNITGLVGIFLPILLAKGELFIEPTFNAQIALELLKEENIDYFHGSPTVFISLIDAARKTKLIAPAMKILACGSSNMPLQDIAILEDIFPNAEFRPIYGLTESTSPGTIMPEHALHSAQLGAAGQPVPGFEVKICDDRNEEVNEGLTGIIWIRGTNVIRDYYPENFHLIDPEAWLNTGDVGKLVNDYLYVVDRVKDVINRGGEKIYSFEVEKLICDLKELNIKEVALVGLPDHKYGEVPIAVISTFDSSVPDITRIKSYISVHLAKYKRPVKYIIWPDLPKNKNNKLDKNIIKNMAGAAVSKGEYFE